MSKLSKIEKILEQEGYVDWVGGTLKAGQRETIPYDESIVMMKRKDDGSYYMKVYVTNKIHRKYWKEK